MTPFRILFACSANVCRSPAAAVLATQALSRVSIGDIVIESGGVDAVPGRPFCPNAARWLQDRYRVIRLPEREARPIDASMILGSGLLLAADRLVCATILRQVPTCRPRLFTMREAAALAAAVTGSVAQGAGSTGRSVVIDGVTRPSAAHTRAERLSWLVDEMDAARGRVPMPHGRRGRIVGRRTRVPPLDVPDVHTGVGVSHRQMFGVLAPTIGAWMESVQRVLTLQPPD